MPAPADTAHAENALPAKAAIVAALRAALVARLHGAQSAAAAAFAAATEEEARAENKYDTRALEQSYISAGHNARIATLRDAVAAVSFLVLPEARQSQVGPLALAEVEIADHATVQRRWLFVLDVGVGEAVMVDGVEVHVCEVRAPLALALRGRSADDVVVLPGRPGAEARTVTVLRVV